MDVPVFPSVGPESKEVSRRRACFPVNFLGRRSTTHNRRPWIWSRTWLTVRSSVVW